MICSVLGDDVTYMSKWELRRANSNFVIFAREWFHIFLASIQICGIYILGDLYGNGEFFWVLVFTEIKFMKDDQ